MSISEFINQLPEDRRKLIQQLHELIIKEDSSVTATIEPMMRVEMIIYKAGIFKYGLASVKNHMSLHVLPMYMSPKIHDKYKPLLKEAAFQKGCINFKKENEMPLNIVRDLIAECSKIDMQKIRDAQIKSKKSKKS